MGMRVTTGMMMNTYRYNLQGSTSNLSDARNKVLSQRKFDSYAEDPSAATMAWRIRRAMYSNADYQINNDDTYSRFNIAWTTMGVVNDQLSDKDGRFSTIRALTDSTASGRQPLGQVLSNGAETIVQAMNSAKYGDHFVFAGNDEMNVPFSWSADMKTLYYRGVDVAAKEVKMPERTPDTPKWVPAAGDYSLPKEVPAKKAVPPITDTSTDEEKANAAKIEEENAWIDYYNSDWAKLQAMSHEEENVDLGMGLQEDKDGNLINGSAFNRSLPGVNMLGGFGLDEDGDPKNVVLIMKELGELCSKCDSETGAWDPDPATASAIAEKANRLLDKLIKARDRTTEAYDEIDTKGHFLQENQSRLKMQGDYLQEERANLEQVDLADAITEFSWDYYCYSAALKIGNQLLSQTLIDYMT